MIGDRCFRRLPFFYDSGPASSENPGGSHGAVQELHGLPSGWRVLPGQRGSGIRHSAGCSWSLMQKDLRKGVKTVRGIRSGAFFPPSRPRCVEYPPNVFPFTAIRLPESRHTGIN